MHKKNKKNKKTLEFTFKKDNGFCRFINYYFRITNCNFI